MTDDKLFMERLPGDEWHDEIRITTVPRYKTSGLSGSEWRTSAHVQVFRKGKLLYERSYHQIRDAAAHLPWLLLTYGESEFAAITDPSLTRGQCMQPGCGDQAVTAYRKTADGCGRCGGVREHEAADPFPKCREFCARHARRGDSNLDDMDDHYEVVSGPGPDGPGKQSRDESPSAFGGVIEVGDD